MDLDLTEDERAFQQEARTWLAANVPSAPLPSMDTAAGFVAHQEWEARLAEARWSVVSWPERYGGRGASLVEWVVFEEEYYRAGAPGRVSQNGIFLLAPILFDHGTPDQQDRFLPSMATGERVWAQAWSEPEAGSDLASLRSTATRDDDRGGWLLNGQKTWSSRASYAHWGFGLFRSDPSAERHHGLTYFLFPLDAAGVTVRPIAQLDGEAGFAEIFLDDVFVPDADVLGGVGDGWRVEMGAAGSVNKVFWSELDIALHETALDLRGPEAEVRDAWSDGYLFSLSGPIYAGTNEIQRNIVAERVLGLPRWSGGAR